MIDPLRPATRTKRSSPDSLTSTKDEPGRTRTSDVQVIGADRIRDHVSFEDLIEPTIEAFVAESTGRAMSEQLEIYPDRSDRTVGDVLIKTGVIEGYGSYLTKIAPWFKANQVTGMPQGGSVSVFDASNGHLTAVLVDEHHLSDVRTAAAGAICARYLAPPKVTRAVIVGTGVQAALQAAALYSERPFEELTIWGRNHQHAQRLARRLGNQFRDVTVSVAGTLETAVRDSDVIVTATGAERPLIHGDWLHTGQHITAVGADAPHKCELAADALHRSRVFVDSRHAAAHNGDILNAHDAEWNLESVEAELGEVIATPDSYQRDPADITIATLVGLGSQDLTTAVAAMRLLGLSA